MTLSVDTLNQRSPYALMQLGELTFRFVTDQQIHYTVGFYKDTIFMDREFGELVDDWYAHNNLNRASRSWGERPQLVQALSLLNSTNELYKTTGQFIGGCQWHPFDHQRGYHPDPYWGGIYDAFRQPKTALNMFKARLTSVLSDAEKAKMLQEVEAQQADFGLQK